MTRKSDLAIEGVKLIKKIQNNFGIRIKTLRMDNAGEITSLRDEIVKEQLGIKCEFTAAGTLQQNGVVERSFVTLYGKVRAMFKWADLDNKTRQKLWAECANLATCLDNLIVNEITKKSPCDLMIGEKPKFCASLKVFGEVGICRRVELGSLKPKLEDKGVLCIFVGYCEDHGEGVYRMYNPSTGQVRICRDVRWMGKNINAYNSSQGSGNLWREMGIEDNKSTEIGAEKKERNQMIYLMKS